MANIHNRSPWVVQSPNHEDQKFRLKSQAMACLASLKNKKATAKQLDTAWEVQIRLKDREGNVIQRTKTLDSESLAQAWATEEEARILDYKKQNGSFDISYETMTLEEALKKVLEEHYKDKASYVTYHYRIPKIVEWFGKKTLFRDINSKWMLRYRDKLKQDGYAAGTIRSDFVLFQVMFKHAKSEWQFPITNPSEGIKLDKPNNAIERYWVGDEKDRLFTAIKKRSPWLLPIVEMSLEMSFRRGELVPRTLTKIGSDGLQWEGVNFEKETIKLFSEKNDHTKKNTEVKGRTVPMTRRMKEILLEEYEKSETKKGRVFDRSGNSVSHAFAECCKAAEPPIEELTFHSCRKIATYDLSRKVENPILLGKLTGHKSIVVLAERYYKAPIEDLQALVRQYDSDDVLGKGISLLEKHLGPNEAKAFVNKVRQLAVADEEELKGMLKNSEGESSKSAKKVHGLLDVMK